MKVRVVFKTPDAVDEGILHALQMTQTPGLDDDERADVLQGRLAKLKDKARKWFEYGEYVTIEWDTEANTCTVIPQ